jgi:hypothetical protein
MIANYISTHTQFLFNQCLLGPVHTEHINLLNGRWLCVQDGQQTVSISICFIVKA